VSLFAELKRRNVFRVAALYLVAAWVVLQVGELLLGLLGLPAWSNKLLFAGLVLGFVPALIFSWVYELTPEGLKREHEIERNASITAETARKLDLIVVGLLVVADRRRGRGAVHSARGAHPGRNRCSVRSVVSEGTGRGRGEIHRGAAVR
jgi:hypothetical protein